MMADVLTIDPVANQQQRGPKFGALGNALRNEIGRRDLTTYEVAALLDVSQPTVSRWVNGISAPSRFDHEQRVAKFLHITHDELRQLKYAAAGFVTPEELRVAVVDLSAQTVDLEARLSGIEETVAEVKSVLDLLVKMLDVPKFRSQARRRD